MDFPRIELTLPDWLGPMLKGRTRVYPSVEDKMRLVIDLARSNVEKGTGGPFGAAVFEMNTHRLVAPGVNQVLKLNCSIVHAEIMAIMIAQKIMGSYDLGGAGMPSLELVSSTEPCAMCFGAVPWSGVKRLICGARDEDARAIGFDEGPKMSDWQKALEDRGIEVVRDICREEAASVLRLYQEKGGIIYNSGQGSR